MDRRKRIVMIGWWLLLVWQVPILVFACLACLLHFVPGGVSVWIGASYFSSGVPELPGRNPRYLLTALICGAIAAGYCYVLYLVTRRGQR